VARAAACVIPPRPRAPNARGRNQRTGGQAGSVQKIEIIWDFRQVYPDKELAGRAYTQAQKFGAEMMIVARAVKLSCERKPYAIEIDGGARTSCGTIIIASGAEYRTLPLQNLSSFEGAGVYYGATFIEAQLCGSEEVIVVGAQLSGASRGFSCHRPPSMCMC